MLIAVPFLLILINSFKSPADYTDGGPLSLPTRLYLDGIVDVLEPRELPAEALEQLSSSRASVAILAVVISVLNAYAIGIGRVRGRTWIIVLFLLANMLPQEALLYPLYFMFKQVGLYDNVWAVIIIFTVIQSAFGTYLLSSVYGTFPKEILEAASLDGASRWQILWRVIVPISRPTLVGAAHLLLHLDVERVPHPADVPGEQRQPDGARRDQPSCRATGSWTSRRPARRRCSASSRRSSSSSSSSAP